MIKRNIQSAKQKYMSKENMWKQCLKEVLAARKSNFYSKSPKNERMHFKGDLKKESEGQKLFKNVLKGLNEHQTVRTTSKEKYIWRKRSSKEKEKSSRMFLEKSLYTQKSLKNRKESLQKQDPKQIEIEFYSAAGNVSEFDDAGLRVYAGLQVCWV